MFALLFVLLLQQRPLADIAADLDKLAAELRAWQAPADDTVVKNGENLQAALNAAEVGATVRLEDGATFTGNFIISKTITLVTSAAKLVTPSVAPALLVAGDDVLISGVRVESAAGASTNDLVVVNGAHAVFVNVVVVGNGTTKRGISAQGNGLTLDHVQVLRIGRVGQESQAVATWDGTAITIKDSTLEAGSTGFLSGGATPKVPNHIPSDILLERVTITHPLDWKGKGYVNKTGFECKSCQRVVVRDSTIENVWVDGQTGFAITLTPSQYGNSPETTVSNVVFEHNTIRNVGGGVNILGRTQHPENPTLQGSNFRFTDNLITISRATNGGQGALMQIGNGPVNLSWSGNEVTTDGDAFVRVSDKVSMMGFRFDGNKVVLTGTYGVFTPVGSRGTNFNQLFPDGLIVNNEFTNAHSTFKQNFPTNTWKVQ